MPSCAIRAADEFVIFHPFAWTSRNATTNGMVEERKGNTGWKITLDSWFFSLFDSYYCSNRIFEIDTKYRTKLIRMKLKRKESAKNKKKKNIFIKIIFLVRGEKVNWKLHWANYFFPWPIFVFRKDRFSKVRRVYGCRWLSLDFTNLWYMPSAPVQKLRYSKNR